MKEDARSKSLAMSIHNSDSPCHFDEFRDMKIQCTMVGKSIRNYLTWV